MIITGTVCVLTCMTLTDDSHCHGVSAHNQNSQQDQDGVFTFIGILDEFCFWNQKITAQIRIGCRIRSLTEIHVGLCPDLNRVHVQPTRQSASQHERSELP